MDPTELRRLLAFRSELDRIEANPQPAARLLVRPAGAPEHPRSLAVMPGAFDPPTRAHVALAEAAASLGFDALLFSLGRLTLDKENSRGLMIEDRLLLLSEIAGTRPKIGIVIQNRGLYLEMAAAVRSLHPELDDLAFVVGADKVPQLFDPRYYDDAEGSIAGLFAAARFLVAPRGPRDRPDLERWIATRAGGRYSSRFDWLDLDERWRHVSATDARGRWAQDPRAASLLPENVAGFLRRTGAYGAGDLYSRRKRALEEAATAAG